MSSLFSCPRQVLCRESVCYTLSNTHVTSYFKGAAKQGVVVTPHVSVTKDNAHVLGPQISAAERAKSIFNSLLLCIGLLE